MKCKMVLTLSEAVRIVPTAPGREGNNAFEVLRAIMAVSMDHLPMYLFQVMTYPRNWIMLIQPLHC